MKQAALGLVLSAVLFASAAPSLSTNVTDPAPRLSASKPNEPVPAYKSRTIAASILAPRAEKTASRIRSIGGRVAEPRGPTSRRPLAMPAMILTPSTPGRAS